MYKNFNLCERFSSFRSKTLEGRKNENRGAIFVGRNVAETLRKILKTQEYKKIKAKNNGKIDTDELIENTLNQIDTLEKVTEDYKRLLDELKILCLIFAMILKAR